MGSQGAARHQTHARTQRRVRSYTTPAPDRRNMAISKRQHPQSRKRGWAAGAQGGPPAIRLSFRADGFSVWCNVVQNRAKTFFGLVQAVRRGRASRRRSRRTSGKGIRADQSGHSTWGRAGPDDSSGCPLFLFRFRDQRTLLAGLPHPQEICSTCAPDKSHCLGRVGQN